MQLFSPNAEALEEAKRQIKALTAEVEQGQIYHGKVSRIVDFGAFINLLPGKDGLLHISQICSDRNQKVESVLQEGQDIEVLVAGVDKQGKVKLEWLNKPGAAAAVQKPESEAIVASPEAQTETETNSETAGVKEESPESSSEE